MHIMLLLLSSLIILIALIIGMLLLALKSMRKMRNFVISEARSTYTEVENSKAEVILLAGKIRSTKQRHMQSHMHMRNEKTAATGNDLIDIVTELQAEYSSTMALVNKAKHSYYNNDQSENSAALAEITSRLKKRVGSFNKIVKLFNAVIAKPPYILFTKYLNLKHVAELK